MNPLPCYNFLSPRYSVIVNNDLETKVYHQLVLSYPKFKSDYGAFNSPPMYLEKESVKVLLSLLQDKSINESILKIEKQIQDQNESYQ